MNLHDCFEVLKTIKSKIFKMSLNDIKVSLSLSRGEFKTPEDSSPFIRIRFFILIIPSKMSIRLIKNARISKNVPHHLPQLLASPSDSTSAVR